MTWRKSILEESGTLTASDPTGTGRTQFAQVGGPSSTWNVPRMQDTSGMFYIQFSADPDIQAGSECYMQLKEKEADTWSTVFALNADGSLGDRIELDLRAKPTGNLDHDSWACAFSGMPTAPIFRWRFFNVDANNTTTFNAWVVI